MRPKHCIRMQVTEEDHRFSNLVAALQGGQFIEDIAQLELGFAVLLATPMEVTEAAIALKNLETPTFHGNIWSSSSAVVSGT